VADSESGPEETAMSEEASDYELKPCPWCGAAAEFVQDRTSNWWYIGTPCKCEIMFTMPKKSDAAKWWNRREQESKVEAERDKWRALAVIAENALRKISEGRGPFSRDQLTFATNVIEESKSLANEALAKMESEKTCTTPNPT